MPSRRVLILYASAGMGHYRVAQALEEALHFLSGDVEVHVSDALDYTNPIFKNLYGGGYIGIVKNSPELWGYLYNKCNDVSFSRKSEKLRGILAKANSPEFLSHVLEHDPHVIVCTHFFPVGLLSPQKKRGRLTSSIQCIITDFALHSFWVRSPVDKYFVPTEESKRSLVRRGQSAESVHVLGIPVARRFAEPSVPREERERLGLEPTADTILVLSGGFGVGPVAAIVKSFEGAGEGLQLVVICGKNLALQRRLAALRDDRSIPMHVHGWVDNVAEFMGAADVVITKPGGSTISEILAKNVPMVIVDPIPGQEQRNCEYLLEEGAAIRLHDMQEAAYCIRKLLSDKEKLVAMRANVARIARPNAARDIARVVLSSI